MVKTVNDGLTSSSQVKKKNKLGVWLIGVFVVAIVILVGMYAYSVQLRTPDEVLGIQGESLMDEEGRERGVAWKELDGELWRIFSIVELETPAAGRSYHGWFKNPFTEDIRYAGEFFATEEGKYSLTFTTEEDVHAFSLFQVTRERRESPRQPGNIIAEWQFSKSREVIKREDEDESEKETLEEQLDGEEAQEELEEEIPDEEVQE